MWGIRWLEKYPKKARNGNTEGKREHRPFQKKKRAKPLLTRPTAGGPKTLKRRTTSSHPKKGENAWYGVRRGKTEFLQQNFAASRKKKDQI